MNVEKDIKTRTYMAYEFQRRQQEQARTIAANVTLMRPLCECL